MRLMSLPYAAIVLTGLSAMAIAQLSPGQSGQGPGQAGRIEQPLPRSSDRPEQPTFDTVDQNADGQLSRGEANGLDGFNFARADTDDDATLTREEYVAAIAVVTTREENGASRGDRTAQVSFDTADRNKDGKLSREEANKIRGLSFRRADANDDASLTRQEFQIAMAGDLSRG
jgi:hypothetical protein